MRGGYLTIDLSNVPFKEVDSASNFNFGKKKGIFEYIKKTDKPISVKFNDLLLKNLYEQWNCNYLFTPSKEFVLETILDDTDLLVNDEIVTFYVFKSRENIIVPEGSGNTSSNPVVGYYTGFTLSIKKNDEIILSEL